MPSFSELPIEVLLDNIFPHVPVSGLLNLTCASKLFAVLCSDDTLWKQKLLTDFNFTGEGTARTSGWKFIYRGLAKPKVFVWGEKANGRLGLPVFPKSSVNGVPFPFQVKIPGVRIVSLVAGGMSFHALDSEGRVHVWGTLDGSMPALRSDGFAESGKRTDTPLTLELPAPIRSISCGRLHSSALDYENRIWTFINWGRPFWLSSPILSIPGSLPLQVECGWSFSSLLMTGGEVFVWFPFRGRLHEIVSQKEALMNAEKDKQARATENGMIPCITWSVDLEPVGLPPLPILPDLPDTGNEKKSPIPQLVQIAAFDRHIVGITDHGHVLKYGPFDDETSIPRVRWEYLPKFSEVELVREHKTFAGENGDRQGCPDAPQTLQITHISASFKHFVAYSTGATSIVLMGDTDTTPDSDPKITPALQNRSVISVVLGDYHNAALTANGKLYTWGAFSAGALGLGDPGKLEPGRPGAYASAATIGRRRREPPAVEIPTEVRFDHGAKTPKELFCFAITAAGWHTGALVIDLEPDGDEEDEIEMEEPELDINPDYIPNMDPHRYESPPIIPWSGRFRIGHAGRGISGRGIGGGRRDEGSSRGSGGIFNPEGSN